MVFQICSYGYYYFKKVCDQYGKRKCIKMETLWLFFPTSPKRRHWLNLYITSKVQLIFIWNNSIKIFIFLYIHFKQSKTLHCKLFFDAFLLFSLFEGMGKVTLLTSTCPVSFLCFIFNHFIKYIYFFTVFRWTFM